MSSSSRNTTCCTRSWRPTAWNASSTRPSVRFYCGLLVFVFGLSNCHTCLTCRFWSHLKPSPLLLPRWACLLLPCSVQRLVFLLSSFSTRSMTSPPYLFTCSCLGQQTSLIRPMELIVQHQANELGLFQQALIELDRQHQKMRQSLEEENLRLRRDLTLAAAAVCCYDTNDLSPLRICLP